MGKEAKGTKERQSALKEPLPNYRGQIPLLMSGTAIYGTVHRETNNGSENVPFCYIRELL